MLICGDCLDVMAGIADGSVDLILADLPYGTTACRWDTVIPFAPLWAHYKRVIKRNGAIVLTASQPFTSALVMSNPKWFKYTLVWDKGYGRQPQLANVQPMKRHEDVAVFGAGRITYNPQKTPLAKPYTASGGNNCRSRNNHSIGLKSVTRTYTHKTPDSVLLFAPPRWGSHDTQKPVALMEYLIRTYTNAGELVLDNTMGSGTTGVACLNTGRRFIGIEKDPEIFATAKARIEAVQPQLIPA
jgi:DNA modification methylase